MTGFNTEWETIDDDELKLELTDEEKVELAKKNRPMSEADEVKEYFLSNSAAFWGKVTEVDCVHLEDSDNAKYYLIIATYKKNGERKLMQVYYKSLRTGNIKHTQKIITFPIELSDEVGIHLC